MSLRSGYLLSAIITGFLLLLSFLLTIPDGKLHIYFCNVGQGDAIYIRFPDGRDMLVDAGPRSSVLRCLSAYMPFWDHQLDIAVLTHPQQDHMAGFLPVLERYTVARMLRSDVRATSAEYAEFERKLRAAGTPVHYLTGGDVLAVGGVRCYTLWPSREQVARAAPASLPEPTAVLGTTTDLNDFSVVMHLRYGTFDALLTGDADERSQSGVRTRVLADSPLEVLKVPHHGARTALTRAFVEALRPAVAVISVGTNSYGHPSPESISLLESVQARIYRTDQAGDIEVVTDGRGWTLRHHPPRQ